MPATHTYPGVYIEEVPSGVRTITGVSTSNTAFIDYFPRGSIDGAVRITSWADFEREFGGLDNRSEASYAIQQFYLNGGQVAFVVRVAAGATAATLTLTLSTSTPIGTITLEAANPGIWGQNVQVVALKVLKPDGTVDTSQFNLAVREVRTSDGAVLSTEIFRGLDLTSSSPNYAWTVVNAGSALVKVTNTGLGGFPDLADPNATGDGPSSTSSTGFVALANGSDGTAAQLDGTMKLDATDFVPTTAGVKSPLEALDRIAPEIFNILCIPAAANLATDITTTGLAPMQTVVSAAETYCETKRAFLIVDIPPKLVTNETQMQTFMAALGKSNNAAVYFPRIQIPDLLQNSRPRDVGASGTMAGIYARTDSTRGVWKTPAGTDAVLRNASLTLKLTDLENGGLNPIGVNVLRNFPVFGNVAWGGRTLNGADQLASEWKYIAVKRTALYIEESLFEALQWVVFEPNDEPLWAQIRMNVGAFMHDLFRQGAFQGNAPNKAYFVKCDSETTTQNDIDKGVVNIWVGVAPLKPAEFVVIKLQQIAGQIET